MSNEPKAVAEETTEETTEVVEEKVLTEEEIEAMKNQEIAFKQNLNEVLTMITSRVQLDLILSEINGILIRNNLANTPDDVAAYMYKISKKHSVDGKEGIVKDGDNEIRWIISPLDNSIIIVLQDGTIAYHNVTNGVVVDANGQLCSPELSLRLEAYYEEFNASISDKVTELMKIDACDVSLTITEAVPLSEEESDGKEQSDEQNEAGENTEEQS